MRATTGFSRAAPYRTIEDSGFQYEEDYFVYNIDFVNLLAGNSTQGVIQLQADSDFKWVKSTYFSVITGGATQTTDSFILPSVNVLITDGGSGRQLSQSPVNITSTFGVGTLPYILPIERIFKGRSNISINVSNVGADDFDLLQLNFIGVKMFKRG